MHFIHCHSIYLVFLFITSKIWSATSPLLLFIIITSSRTMFPTHLPYCIFYLFFYLFYHDLINYLLLFKLVSTPKMIFLHWIMIPLIDFLRSSLDVTFSHGIFNSFACTKNFIIVTFYFFNPLLGHKILFLGALVDASFCTLKYP